MNGIQRMEQLRKWHPTKHTEMSLTVLARNVRPWIRWISFSLAVGFAIHVVQGVIAGAVLAYFTANLVICPWPS